ATDQSGPRVQQLQKAALERLSRSIELGFPDLDWMRRDPNLASLRHLEEFQQLATPDPDGDQTPQQQQRPGPPGPRPPRPPPPGEQWPPRMVHLNRITTRSGDDGWTSLGDGTRVPKPHPRVAALGALDELNAAVGFALSIGSWHGVALSAQGDAV